MTHDTCVTCGELVRADEYCVYCTIPMQWIPVEKRLPEIPEGTYGISVLVAMFDSIYDELCPGKGYSVEEAMFAFYDDRHGKRMTYFEGFEEDRGFMFLCIGGKDGGGWHPPVDKVTHWMPLPPPPEVPNGR